MNQPHLTEPENQGRFFRFRSAGSVLNARCDFRQSYFSALHSAKSACLRKEVTR